MAEFLETYLKMGLSKIVVTDHTFHEDHTGRIEDTTETVVAFNGKKYVEVGVAEHKNYWPNGGTNFNVSTHAEISEARYKELTAGKEISDTPVALQRLENLKKANEESRAASEQLSKVTPQCPNCKRRMKIRKGPRGRFWGCASYPDCKGTRELTPEQARLYETASRL